MKNIVVGIDFSQGSLNALKHAVALSLKTGGKLHLVWVKTPGATKGLGVDNVKSFEQKAEEKLCELAKECKAESPKSLVNNIILEGKPSVELTKYAANLQDAIIVIGTHGVSGYEEMFVGSNAFKTVAISKVPVITLREGVQINRDLTRILIPIDSSFETLQKIRLSIKIAKAFAAKIILLGLHTSGIPEVKHQINVQLDHARAMCEENSVRFDIAELNVKGAASKAVIDFAMKEDINLIVTMKDEDDDITNLWLGSYTRQLVNHSPIPLLTIPNVNHYLITK